jgi:hypothetical protein
MRHTPRLPASANVAKAPTCLRRLWRLSVVEALPQHRDAACSASDGDKSVINKC